MKMFTGLSLAFVAVLSLVSEGNCDGTENATNSHYFHAYTDAGDDYKFTTNVPDLSVYNMDNRITRACQTGLWLLYSNTDYDYYEPGFGTCEPATGIDICADMGGCMRASSLRYAGSPYGLNEPYYNLYSSGAFVGLEFAGNHTTPTVDNPNMKAYSVIISGTDSWTLFE
ncbi:uncharacterized protein LOC108674824 [Hyalella azteca]|uniref:Uncharacterized protein LOC108674824 n=1 Tax=Hyalella azteca TaxID=294128 RepID=A0A8B7NX40_HYAAZ|nr:uncharacterized protein LOC108674824 [Hyalella azteca]